MVSQKATGLGIVLALLLILTNTVYADDPIADGLIWLGSQQQDDGGFTNGFSEGADLGTTCDIILAIAAAQQDVTAWTSEAGNSPLDYLQAQITAGNVDLIGEKAKVSLALLALGQDPTSFAGFDLIGEIQADYDESSGSYGSSIYDQALIILALDHADQPVPIEAVSYLVDSQSEDGAWALFGDTEDSVGDTNTTALAIQALIATDHAEGIDAALSYLHTVQNSDGGFPYQNPSEYGTDTDANSTAIVYQAIVAAGEPLDEWAPEGIDPLEALISLYDPETGAFFWQATVPAPNVLATAQAIPALAGFTFVNLPRIEVTATEEASVEPTGVSLPAAGGTAALPLGLVGLGLICLNTGLLLRRH